MGFESFRIELRGGKAPYHEVEAFVRQLPHVRSDSESLPSRGSSYYVLDDGRHVIEMEIKDSPLRLSCRFTLCHPPSVDGPFLGLARHFLDRFGMEATICDDVRPEHAHSWPAADIEGFSAITSGYIADRRQEWMANFGTEPLAATTNEVYQQVILPRCQAGTSAASGKGTGYSRGRTDR
jgi:hypothetical protein